LVLQATDEAAIDPVVASRLLLDDARANGATVLTRTAVEGFDKRDGRVHAVRTRSGAVRVDHVAIAAGHGTENLCAMLGARVPVQRSLGVLAHYRDVDKPWSGEVLMGE